MLAVARHFCKCKRPQFIAQFSSSRDSFNALFGSNPGVSKSPIVDYLWKIRDSEIEANQQVNNVSSHELSLLPQRPRVSHLTYAISTDQNLRDNYINPWGRFRMGRLMEDLDAMAADICIQHCSAGNPNILDNVMLVTASINRIVVKRSEDTMKDTMLSGVVSWVGNSSMEIKIDCLTKGTDGPWLTGYFTFVAVNRNTGKGQKINPLSPETPEEVELYESGKTRVEKRKEILKRAKQNIFELKNQAELISLKGEAKQITIDDAAKRLWEDARNRLKLPVRGLVNSVRMSDTKLSNTLIMQPQQRNPAGRIFGGFLVRRAFELAFATAYRFGGVVPRFREIDEVIFKTPVDIGDLVHFESAVLFTSYQIHENPSIHVMVTASVMNPGASSHRLSNTFCFTFDIPSDTPWTLPRVIPESLEECVVALTRYHGDLIQKEEDELENKNK